MSPKGTYREQVRERLLSFWERREEFGTPVGCACTSFTFNAAFFEEECLSRFVGMDTDAKEDGRLYLVEREEKLSQIFSCVLVDRSHVDPKRSLRWNLLPVTVPGDGVLHAKLALLAWQHRIRVLLGSANLTEPGYRRNFEHFAALDFTPDGTLPISLLRQCIDFLDRVRTFAPGAERPTVEGPQAGLDAFLGRVVDLTDDWKPGDWRQGQPRVEVLPVFPGGASLFQLTADGPWRGTRPERAWVLSPFYNDGPRAKTVLNSLIEIMGSRGKRTVHLLAPGRKLPDGTIELDLPEAVRTSWTRGVCHRFYRVLDKDKNGEMRRLHAKSLWLERRGRAVYVIGSSNFTGAGTGAVRGPVNIEANLAYVLPRTRDPFARKCRECYPPHEALDPERERIVFRAAEQDETSEPERFAPLPPAFGQALFRPQGETGVLLLEIGPDVPPRFRVRGEKTQVLLDEKTWTKSRSREVTEVAWSEPRPPSFVLVDWWTSEGEGKTAAWIVNVTDGSKLPPPEELRDLPLEVLVEILSSARPLHETLRKFLRRNETENAKKPAIVVDPHKKVDTSNYLLRRVRRISGALEGLRARLERPVYTLDALRWRLHGPVGPSALARQLAEQEGEGAAFMIAEVVLTLRRVDWASVGRGITGETIQAEVAGVYEELRALARQYPPPKNLAEYVDEVFSEVEV